MRKYTPILLLSSERSGTNLLRVIVSSHTKVASPPPCGIVNNLARRAFKYISPLSQPHVKEFIDDAITSTKSHLNPWDIELDPRILSNHMEKPSFWQLFKSLNDLYADENGCSYWLSKEPNLYEYIYEIKMNMPNAKFIYMVRDGRDVSASMLRGGIHINHIYDAAVRWKSDQKQCLNALSDPLLNKSIFMLKYEDLITAPELVVGNLMEFLGLVFEPSQMKFYQKKEIIKHSHSTEFWKNISKPINSSNMGKYKKYLNTKQIAIFESVAWDEMHALGYKVDNHSRKKLSFLEKGAFKISAIVRNKIKQMDGKEETKRQQQRVIRAREVTNRSFYK